VSSSTLLRTQAHWKCRTVSIAGQDTPIAPIAPNLRHHPLSPLLHSSTPLSVVRQPSTLPANHPDSHVQRLLINPAYNNPCPLPLLSSQCSSNDCLVDPVPTRTPKTITTTVLAQQQTQSSTGTAQTRLVNRPRNTTHSTPLLASSPLPQRRRSGPTRRTRAPCFPGHKPRQIPTVDCPPTATAPPMDAVPYS
jgi:hypothetical protein